MWASCNAFKMCTTLSPPRPKPTLNAPTKHKTRAMNEFFEHGQASENESETTGRLLCSAWLTNYYELGGLAVGRKFQPFAARHRRRYTRFFFKVCKTL
jgi:hypothetical protein